MGDFNCVLNRDERIGSTVREGEMMPFRRCTANCGLDDMQYTGCFYTWNNKQAGERSVYCKLDRFLCNELWCDKFPEYEAWFMLEGVFDHSPMIVNVFAERRRGKTPFRYFKMWSLAPEFHNRIKECWDNNIAGTHMFSVCGTTIEDD